jgi:hypothetical protein
MEAMADNEAIITESKEPVVSAHARAVNSAAELATIINRSRVLVATAARLTGTVPRIRGGSDLDSPFVVELISKASLCQPCLAGKTGISQLRIAEAIDRIGAFMVVHAESARCAGCLNVTTTYRVSDRATNGPAEPVPQTLTTLNGALWRFLEDHRGQMFCTQCIAKALFATRRIDRAVLGAEGRGARRHYGTCAACGKERLLCGLAK